MNKKSIKKQPTKTQNHPDQISLFGTAEELIEVPAQPEAQPGIFNFDRSIRRSLNKAINASPYNRHQLAEMLSELCGRYISKPMLDTYTGASRPNKLPADLLPALTFLLGPDLLTEIGAAAGCAVLEERQASFARIGQLQFMVLQARAEQEKTIAALPLLQAAGAGRA